jgi:CubicO group peptidase (beta-lactamase class C family)
MRGIKCVLSVSAVFILAACGGGGGGGDDPPAPPAQNARPTVNAGSDATATLPTATVALTGSATDDGPAASLTYQWSAAPAAGVTFSAGTAAASNVTFTTAGTYTLTLTVSDGTQTGTDTLSVTVSAAAQAWPAADTNETDPFRGWTKVDASAVGMTQSGLDTAATFAQNVPATVRDPVSGLTTGGAGMIVRGGQLVHSWGDIDRRQSVKSVTKSMGGIVLGLAYDENKVEMETTGVTYMGTFGTPPSGNATAAQTITLNQLATHTAGFGKDGGFVALIPQGPGAAWKYSDAGLNWLADVLTTVYQRDLAALAQERVWAVLGLNNGGLNTDDVFWRTNAQRPATRDGGTIQFRELASGLDANVNAMARVGLLFLRKGDWNGTRVLSAEFVDRVQKPLPENASLPVLVEQQGEQYPNAQTDYGILWWTNKSGTMANVPTDAYWAWGLGEALIVVIPSLDLVIARNGGQDTAPSTGRIWNDLNWDGDVEALEGFLAPIVDATTP